MAMLFAVHPTNISSSSSSAPLLLSKTPFFHRNARLRGPHTYERWGRIQTLCIRSSNENKGEESSLLKMDRRNMLIGLGGGLYGATVAGLGGNQAAVADPIVPPDLTNCVCATDDTASFACCPPKDSIKPRDSIPDYIIPKDQTPRQRKPIHLMTDDEIAKFEKAIDKMKKLDINDPRNFYQQAQMHCAFCNGAYGQWGHEDVPIQVHFSWIFLPWHRWYIYFWEKMLGELIDDDTLAIPFWNFDNTDEGATFPKSYSVCKSPLYDALRHPEHAVGGSYMDLNFSPVGTYVKPSDAEILKKNMERVHRIFDTAKGVPLLFIGDTLAAGETAVGFTQEGPPPAGGTLEALHNTVHAWVGPSDWPLFDMGSFVSAARDPIFFGLHANVDRLWQIYRTDYMKPEVETTSTDWQEAKFTFYDEKGNLVNVNVKDALDPSILGYKYLEVPTPWKDYKPDPSSVAKTKARSGVKTRVEEFGTEPRALDRNIRALVKRPKANRDTSEIDTTEEIVIVDGIEVGPREHAKFDVYVTTPIGNYVDSNLGFYAGSFVAVASGHNHGTDAKGNKKKLALKLGISDLVAQLNAETSDNLVVTLVPQGGTVTVGGIRIEQVKI